MRQKNVLDNPAHRPPSSFQTLYYITWVLCVTQIRKLIREMARRVKGHAASVAVL